MAKQVSVNMLKKDVDVFDKYVEIPVNVADSNEPFIIKLYPYFKPEKIRDCVKDMGLFFKKCEDEKITISKEEEDDIVVFFIIRHFTNLKMSSSEKAKRIYNDFKTVINSDVYRFLVDTLPEESITKVFDFAFETIKNVEKIHNKTVEHQNLIKDLRVKHKDVLEQINNAESNPLQ